MSRTVNVLLAAAVTVLPLSRCADDSGPTGASTTEASSTSGEVWHWALGRELFVDPLVTPYTADLDAGAGAEVVVPEQGFELVGDRYGRVASVILLAAGPDVSAYSGELPQPLTAPMTWQSTAADLGIVDDPAVACSTSTSSSTSTGADVGCTYDVVDHEGHLVTLTFAADSLDDLPTATLGSVEVSWRGMTSLYQPQ